MAFSYYITSRRGLGVEGEQRQRAALHQTVRAAYLAGVDYVQIREKDLPGRQLASLVEELAALPEKGQTRLLVNERVDIARTCGADGAHLPSDSLPITVVRSWVSAPWVLGKSCHEQQEVDQAAQAGADYVLVGPVFPTPSKPGSPGIGVSGLAAICRSTSVPVFALGGISRENAADCVRAGASGVAGIRLFQQAGDLEELCKYLRSL